MQRKRSCILLLWFFIFGGVAQAGKQVSITDFGAFCNDGKNDTPAMKKAAAYCQRHPGTILFFPAGQYEFAEPADHRSAAFVLADARNIMIRGDKANLIFHGRQGCFHFYKCQNVTVEGLTIDWARPPFSMGNIIAADKKHFDIRVFDTYPVQGGEPVQAFMDYNPKTKLPARHGLDVYHSVARTELLQPQVLRVHLNHEVDIQPDRWMLLRHEVYSSNALQANHCKNVAIKNVTIYTAPGMGFCARRTENISLNGYRILIKPGTDRLMSTTADGAHLMDCKGEVTIRNCTFEGMGDDAVNVGTLYLTIKKVVDKKTIIAGHNLKLYRTVLPGETMEFCDHQTLLPYAQRKVASAEQLKKDHLVRLTFEKALPDEVKINHVMGNMDLLPTVHISHCRVARNRARGFLLTTPDAKVEHCRFENCTSGGVWIHNEVVFFFQGVGGRNIVVRDNYFKNCLYGGPIGEGVLSAFSYLADFKFPPKPGIHRNIVFANNVIDGSDNCGIFVTGTKGLTIKNNKIINACRQPTLEQGHAAISLSSTADATVTGNKIPPKRQGESIAEPIQIGAGCESDTIIIKNNKGF